MTHCQYWSVQGLSFGYLFICFYLLTSPQITIGMCLMMNFYLCQFEKKLWFYACIFNFPEPGCVLYLLLPLTLPTQHCLLRTQTPCPCTSVPLRLSPPLGTSAHFTWLLSVFRFPRVSLKVTCQFNQSCFPWFAERRGAPSP